MIDHASDEKIITAIQSISSKENIVIGIDAPLSYQDGGGDRPQDKSLRQFIKGYGLTGSSIMPPTLNKNGLFNTPWNGINTKNHATEHSQNIRIVEVHPGAAIGTRIGSKKL